ncbi:MAG: DUF120 domain-containing protein [Candidatus Micrarchaeota archaeon]
MQNRLGLLAMLSFNGAHAGLNTSTASLAAVLGVSQQTASRWLSELAAEGLVERRFGFVQLTSNGAQLLEGLHSSTAPASLSNSAIVLRGRLSRGLGEGGYYLRQPGYAKQFADILGYKPFPGTLNIVLSDASSVAAKQRLVQSKGLRIAGFDRGGRNFGGARLFVAQLNARSRKIPCAVVIPDKTHHGENIVEIVAKDNLRKSLGLKEGQEIEVAVQAS